MTNTTWEGMFYVFWKGVGFYSNFIKWIKKWTLFSIFLDHFKHTVIYQAVLHA